MSGRERNAQVLAPTPHKVLGPGIDGEESREAPEQLAWGLAFPKTTERVPEDPVLSREHLPQLEKIQEVLPSRRDEAHFRRGVSRLITSTSRTSKASFTPLLQLKTFPDIPFCTREKARESRPHPEEPRFRLKAREVGPFPACYGKNSRRSRRISRGGALNRKGERNSRVVPPLPESPRCPSPFQGNLFSLHCLDFQALDRLTSRWHVGQPCGKASWEILVGKP